MSPTRHNGQRVFSDSSYLWVATQVSDNAHPRVLFLNAFPGRIWTGRAATPAKKKKMRKNTRGWCASPVWYTGKDAGDQHQASRPTLGAVAQGRGHPLAACIEHAQSWELPRTKHNRLMARGRRQEKTSTSATQAYQNRD